MKTSFAVKALLSIFLMSGLAFAYDIIDSTPGFNFSAGNTANTYTLTATVVNSTDINT